MYFTFPYICLHFAFGSFDPICIIPFHFTIALGTFFNMTIFAHIFQSARAKCLNDDTLRLIRTRGVLPALSLLHTIDPKTLSVTAVDKKEQGREKAAFLVE